jgi:hypothetical protein
MLYVIGRNRPETQIVHFVFSLDSQLVVSNSLDSTSVDASSTVHGAVNSLALVCRCSDTVRCNIVQYVVCPLYTVVCARHIFR